MAAEVEEKEEYFCVIMKNVQALNFSFYCANKWKRLKDCNVLALPSPQARLSGQHTSCEHHQRFLALYSACPPVWKKSARKSRVSLVLENCLKNSSNSALCTVREIPRSRYSHATTLQHLCARSLVRRMRSVHSHTRAPAKLVQTAKDFRALVAKAPHLTIPRQCTLVDGGKLLFSNAEAKVPKAISQKQTRWIFIFKRWKFR